MKLIELFNNFEQLRSSEEGVTFREDTLPEIPQETTSSSIEINVRRMRRGFGSIDNLVMNIGKSEAFCFGLWIIGALFQRKHKKYTLHLSTPSKEKVYIKEFHLEFRFNDYRLEVHPIEYNWIPKNVEEFVQEAPPYMNERPSIYRNCEHDTFCKCDEWSLNILHGFGGLGASFFAAEFFLNLGWEKSNINYEYFRDYFNPSIGDHNSCEMRVELADNV